MGELITAVAIMALQVGGFVVAYTGRPARLARLLEQAWELVSAPIRAALYWRPHRR